MRTDENFRTTGDLGRQSEREIEFSARSEILVSGEVDTAGGNVSGLAAVRNRSGAPCDVPSSLMLLQDWIEVHSGPPAGQQSLFQTLRRPRDGPESCAGDPK
jgi:hypothetical protein